MGNMPNEHETVGVRAEYLPRPVKADQNSVEEADLDLAHRVRRRGLRGLMRVFWWGMASAAFCFVAGEFDHDRPIYDHYDLLDFMTPIAQTTVLSLSYLLFFFWCFAHSPRFSYRPWEKVGAVIATIVSLVSIIAFAINVIVLGF